MAAKELYKRKSQPSIIFLGGGEVLAFNSPGLEDVIAIPVLCAYE